MVIYNLLVFSFVAFSYCSSEPYFEEQFLNDAFKNTWIYSSHPGKEYGKFVWSAGSFYHNETFDKGMQTSDDAKFYAVSTNFPTFSNDKKPLVIQFSVKHEQNIDCGGGYIKLFDSSLQQEDMHSESPYEIMFGPDICGPGTKKVHVIFKHGEENLQIKKDIRCKDDIYTHFYTLIVNTDNTYEVLIDNEKVESGNFEDDFLPPKKVKDPEARKPSDWDDRPTIDDPNDEKPKDWDKPEHIPDPDAKRPEDWDDEMDGDWEPPMVDNPEYKGLWQPKQIDNPNYKGTWTHPEVDNPEYIPAPKFYLRKDISAIGFDLWQVKSGTIFDNILITYDIDDASKKAAKVKDTQAGEKKMKEAQDEEQRKDEEEKKTNDEDEDKDDIPHDESSSEHDEL